MKDFIVIIVRLLEAGRRTREKKLSFFGIFTFVFFGLVIMLGQFDLLPDASPARATVSEPAVALTVSQKNTERVTPIESIEEPVTIEVPAIGLSATIANPTTTNIEALDKLLLKGAVRYPTSAKLGETGNVVLFGHSSYLPVVLNQAYKTFNGIQKLVVGDVVTVSSSGTAYTYRVRSVAKESAASDAGISLAVVDRELTLATCDSFGAKTDRFIVTADFVESHPISA